MQAITRKTCRICGSARLKPILSLGRICMSAFVDGRRERTPRVPIKLVLCEKCTLLQLKHTAPFEQMYVKQYWYKSNINEVIVNDLKEIASVAIRMAKPKKNDVFLDLGANDGTLLSFVPKKYLRVGFEPAQNLADELIEHCDIAIHDFWRYASGQKSAKIITAIGMLYDLEDPNQFVGDVKKALADDGLFIAQLMTLWPMIKNADVGNMAHEHLEFYSYASLVRLFEQNGLEIFKVEQNNINGGSYRLFARHYKKGSKRLEEPTLDYKDFARRMKRNKERTVAFIKSEVAKGKKVYGYGASTKGNVILQYYGLDGKLISGIADRNPKKHGKFTVATDIPIVSEEEARKHADYFWILPYAFLSNFLKREKAWRKKGKFIVSTPVFKVI